MRVRLLGTLLLLASPLAAQGRFPPDSLKNLQVLPATMTPREVVDLMRGFATSLGVRCVYCHVGEEGQPLSAIDFAKDDRRTKKVAREMYEMMGRINRETIAKLPERPDTGLTVTCSTCHRGVARPVPIERLLAQTVAASGVDSAVRAYRALRDRYYGRAAYDFGELPLMGVATDFSRLKKFDEAVALLNLGNEYFPKSGNVMMALGETYRAKGDTASAIKSYREALVRDPQNGQARQRLTQLGV
ncbi:MAG TPA: c-type cytochrome, partial [Gemmatimonadales bacterium]|nr:c-type cytochrome [Gemmatimonadales bacterium]